MNAVETLPPLPKRVLKKVPPVVWLARQIKRVRRWRRFRSQFGEFRARSAAGRRFPVEWSERMPCLDDATGFTGFDWHYVFHTAWAARMVAAARPARHVDISSSLYFCSITSAFVPVDFYDYRPAGLNLSGLASRRADLMALPFADGSVESLSCMHVVEHVGLGRYGDPLDPDGDLKAMAELRRVLAPGGRLLFVAPVGRPRVVFNAHRVYSTRQIINAFTGLALGEFSLVPDPPRCELVRNAPPDLADAQEYGCGCFLFIRENAACAAEQELR
jgi:SAM-dependent methyltransferase